LETPFGVIPGNHDVPKTDDEPEVPFEWFESEYTSDGYPTVTEVNGLSIIGLDSATLSDPSLRGTWAGEVSEDQLSTLEESLRQSETPLVFVHHNLGPLREHPPSEPWSWFQVSNAERVVNILNQHEVPLALSGHHHLPALTNRGAVTELLAPATCSFPQAYLMLTIGPEGTTATLVPLAEKAGMEEAYSLARNDHPLGSSVLSMVETRIDRLPFAPASSK